MAKASASGSLVRVRFGVMPEPLFAAIVAFVIGWGGFTWRRAEAAMEAADKVSNSVDKLELKLAEKYLTKDEFEHQMERLFKVLGRLEEKLDFHVYNQTQDLKTLRYRLSQYEEPKK